MSTIQSNIQFFICLGPYTALLYQIEKCEKDEKVHCVKKVTP